MDYCKLKGFLLQQKKKNIPQLSHLGKRASGHIGRKFPLQGQHVLSWNMNCPSRMRIPAPLPLQANIGGHSWKESPLSYNPTCMEFLWWPNWLNWESKELKETLSVPFRTRALIMNQCSETRLVDLQKLTRGPQREDKPEAEEFNL